MRPKVFCIGFQKTGTTSLADFLGSLGYEIAGYEPFRDLSHRTVNKTQLADRALQVIQDYDGAQDTPWYVLYRELDEALPGSKFIHVVRDTDSWIKSVVGDFSNHSNTMR